MQPLLILFLGLSSAVNIYYVLAGRKAYLDQIKRKAELDRLMEEVTQLQNDLFLNNLNLRQLIHQVSSQAPQEPEGVFVEAHPIDLRKKPWLN